MVSLLLIGQPSEPSNRRNSHILYVDTDYGPIEDFDEDYEHIKVITGLEMPTLDLLRTVQHQLPQGNTPGNCMFLYVYVSSCCSIFTDCEYTAFL